MTTPKHECCTCRYYTHTGGCYDGKCWCPLPGDLPPWAKKRLAANHVSAHMGRDCQRWEPKHA